MQGMEKAEIKRIGDYLKDLEKGLVEWDYDHITHATIFLNAPPINTIFFEMWC